MPTRVVIRYLQQGDCSDANWARHGDNPVAGALPPWGASRLSTEASRMHKRGADNTQVAGRQHLRSTGPIACCLYAQKKQTLRKHFIPSSAISKASAACQCREASLSVHELSFTHCMLFLRATVNTTCSSGHPASLRRCKQLLQEDARFVGTVEYAITCHWVMQDYSRGGTGDRDRR